MDMVEQLDEITYHLLASAPSRAEALQRVAVVAHWAEEQAKRLRAGRPLRLDHAAVVAEALLNDERAGRAA
jgi:hypothetical protein